MASFLCLALLTALFILSSASSYYPPTYSRLTPPSPTIYFTGFRRRACCAAGDRLSGAPGRPYVAYAPCSDAGHIGLPDAQRGWGRLCLPPPKDYVSCYAIGARCTGLRGGSTLRICRAAMGRRGRGRVWELFCKYAGEGEGTHYVYYPQVEEESERRIGFKWVGDWGTVCAPKAEWAGYKPRYKKWWKDAAPEEYYKSVLDAGMLSL